MPSMTAWAMAMHVVVAPDTASTFTLWLSTIFAGNIVQARLPMPMVSSWLITWQLAILPPAMVVSTYT